MKLRTKAIVDCIYFGLIPSFVYEDTPHYGSGIKNYLAHLAINFRVMAAWLTWSETPEQVALAKSTTVYVKRSRRAT